MGVFGSSKKRRTFYQAVYSFDPGIPGNDSELPVKKGDILEELPFDGNHEGWVYVCKTKTYGLDTPSASIEPIRAENGFVPLNRVQLYNFDPKAAKPRSGRASYTPGTQNPLMDTGELDLPENIASTLERFNTLYEAAEARRKSRYETVLQLTNDMSRMLMDMAAAKEDIQGKMDQLNETLGQWGQQIDESRARLADIQGE
ncbi:Src 3 (SH3) domain [Carpediemonas membranifera]|uniref:Src 3 (SH3) domain n=1 Tax=Carpediemonas membranifera TaxID=201153 RepID=A0A8J6B4Q2_9EUKA|nr:Src 3 (SH3) domain [Carpediemonas membranifera]|eukprot:KAG9395643.1 Src 3 (SH3) domain [Carpediemonas membranifera]